MIQFVILPLYTITEDFNSIHQYVIKVQSSLLTSISLELLLRLSVNSHQIEAQHNIFYKL